MRIVRAIVFLFSLALAVVLTRAQEPPAWEIISPTEAVVIDFKTGVATATNVTIKYENAVLSADRAAVNRETGEAIAAPALAPVTCCTRGSAPG